MASTVVWEIKDAKYALKQWWMKLRIPISTPEESEWFIQLNPTSLECYLCKNSNESDRISINCEPFQTRKDPLLTKDVLTVRCSFLGILVGISEDVHLLAKTRRITQKKSFDWELNDFSFIGTKQKELDSVYKVTLMLTEGHVKVETNVKFSSNVVCELSILDSMGCILHSEKEFGKILSNTIYWYFPNVIKQQKLKTSVLEDKKLCFRLCFISTEWEDVIENVSAAYNNSNASSGASSRNSRVGMRVDNKTEKLPPPQVPHCFLDDYELDEKDDTDVYSDDITPPSSNMCHLSKDLQLLLQEKLYCDFTLQAGDKTFSVHRNILAARSVKLRQQLAATTVFNIILDMDEDTAELFHQFLYGSDLHSIDWPMAAKLYSASVTYQVPSLEQTCAAFLQKHLNDSNVCKILEFGQPAMDTALGKSAVDCIQFREKEIVFSDEWKSLEKKAPQLASEIIRELYMRKLNG